MIVWQVCDNYCPSSNVCFKYNNKSTIGKRSSTSNVGVAKQVTFKKEWKIFNKIIQIFQVSRLRRGFIWKESSELNGKAKSIKVTVNQKWRPVFSVKKKNMTTENHFSSIPCEPTLSLLKWRPLEGRSAKKFIEIVCRLEGYLHVRDRNMKVERLYLRRLNWTVHHYNALIFGSIERDFENCTIPTPATASYVPPILATHVNPGHTSPSSPARRNCRRHPLLVSTPKTPTMHTTPKTPMTPYFLCKKMCNFSTISVNNLSLIVYWIRLLW